MGEQAGDSPQQPRITAEGIHHRFEWNGQDSRRFQRPGHCRSWPAIEHAHLAEQVAGFHQGDDGLAMIDRVGDGDRQAAAQDEMQRLGDVAFVEQHIAADQMLLVPGGSDRCQHLVRRIGEEFGLGKEVFVSHVRRTVLPSPVVSLHAAENVWTIVVAGGTGSRLGRAKQYEQVGSRRVIDHAADVARAVSDGVVVVVPPADVAVEGGVAGGATRSESVRAGLAAVPANATIVCVHDAARPFASTQLYAAVIQAVAEGADAAVPGIPVTDTIKRMDADKIVVDTPPRAALVAVQTPQAFRASILRAAHASGREATDDAALVEICGGRVVVVTGEHTNRKITHLDDLAWAREQADKEGR